MQLHDMLDDREAEPGAAEFARARAIDPIEALGEPRDIGGGNSLAGISDHEFHPEPLPSPFRRPGARASTVTVPPRGVYLSALSSRLSITWCIRSRSADDRRKFVRHFTSSVDAAAARRFAHQLGRFLEHPRGRQRLEFERGEPALEIGERNQVVDQPREPARLAFDNAEKAALRCGIVNAFHQGLGVAIQRGQRRAQFMGQIRDEIGARGLVRFEPA